MNQGKLLLDLICTSRNVSGFVDSRPALDRAAIIFKQLENDYEDISDETKKRYDGSEEDIISEAGFQNKKQTLLEIVEEKVAEVESNIPSDSNNATYSIQLDTVQNDALRMFGITFNHYCGFGEQEKIKLIDFPESAVSELLKPLHQLGTAVTKLEALRYVEQEVALNGSYQFFKEFDSVPDACRYYRKTLEEKDNKSLLKEKIKKYARIYDKGKVLKEWKTINKRINSWWQHEENKYDR